MQDSKQIIFYKSQTGNVKINVFLENETLWLSQKMMAELFGVQENNITYFLFIFHKTSHRSERCAMKLMIPHIKRYK